MVISYSIPIISYLTRLLHDASWLALLNPKRQRLAQSGPFHRFCPNEKAPRLLLGRGNSSICPSKTHSTAAPIAVGRLEVVRFVSVWTTYMVELFHRVHKSPLRASHWPIWSMRWMWVNQQKMAWTESEGSSILLILAVISLSHINADQSSSKAT